MEVKTAVSCEGVYSKNIELTNTIIAYPNPTIGNFSIALPTNQKEVKIDIYSVHSQLISSKLYPIVNGKVQLNIENKPSGLYLAKVHLNNPTTIKIIKK